ncbi:MAG TPA: AI-2E family transporter [Candidatus Dormibacteraeota bacterium]|jgi:predicted PurR-regulated permease PerM
MTAELTQSRLVRALLVPLIVLAWLAVLLLVFWLLSHVTHAVLILVLSTVVAFALTPVVNLLVRWLPRPLAIAIAYVFGFSLLMGLLSVVVVSAATEVNNLTRNLPDYAHRAQALEPQAVGLLSRFGVTQDQLSQAQVRLLGYLQGISTQVASDAFELVKTLLNAIVDTVLILILSIYLVANGPRMVAWVRQQAPRSQVRRANLLVVIVNQVVGGYVRGTLTMALLVGALVGAGMGLLQVRYALLLGILAFFMEFVPVLGVIISGIVCVVIALFQGWQLALIVLAYFVFVHVVEGDVIGPRVMARAVGIHPAVALLALVAGSELFGVWGALLGAPIAGVLQAVATALWREVRLAQIEEPAGRSIVTPSEAAAAARRETA